MSSVLNQLGILLSGRRPGFPGARTPAYNPTQSNPYPQVGGQPEDEEQQQIVRDGSGENRPWYRSLYDGLVNNPAGTSFTLAMANSLLAPPRPGQTGMGQWVEGVTQGYNALGSLAQMRAQAEAQRRKEAREDQKVSNDTTRASVDQQNANTRAGEAFNTASYQERTAEETARHNAATEGISKEEAEARKAQAAANARVAELRFERQMQMQADRNKQLAEQNRLRGQEIANTQTYQGRMADAAGVQAAASMKRAAADMIKAQAEKAAVDQGFTPEQTLKMMDAATKRVEAMTDAELLGGDAKVVKERLTTMLKEVQAEIKSAQKPASGGGGQAPAGRVRWTRDASGNPQPPR